MAGSARIGKTDRIEFVETHNLLLALNRLGATNDSEAWKRALYHAVCMADGLQFWGSRTKLREALGLP